MSRQWRCLIAILVCVCLSGCARGASSQSSVVGSSPSVATEQTADPPARLLVRNPGPERLAIALVEGGFPLPRGAVRSLDRLAVVEAGGRVVETQCRALAYWPDASLKWVELVFYQAALGAGEERTLFLRIGAGGNCGEKPGPRGAAPAGPAGLTIELVDSEGTTMFESREAKVLDDGPIRREILYSGKLRGRDGRTTMTVAVRQYPAVQAVRYQVGIKQLANGGFWKSLRVTVPQAAASVRRQEEMGALVNDGGSDSRVTLIASGNYAVDRGVGRRWDIWGHGDPAIRPGPSLRPRAAPEYLRATQALGPIATRVPDGWARTFERSFQQLLARRDADPANFGWRHYGDFADREHGLEYYGYLDQEYDPATALILGYARTGEEAYLESAVDLASFFRDMSVSPEGGVYEHRATLHTAQAHLIASITPGLLAKLRAHRAYRPSAFALAAVIADLYGPSARQQAVEILDRLEGVPFEELEARFAESAASRIVEQNGERIRSRFSALSPEAARQVTMRKVFEAYAEVAQIRELGFRDVDAAFRPFFARYGGSWSDFPGFHVDSHPDAEQRHKGSHSLAEMLVLTYFLTGDESLRDTALAVARHHVEELVPREIKENQRLLQGRGPIFTRSLAWPLINLMTVWDLTEHRDPDLHAELQRTATKLALQLAANPVERCEGSTSAGLTMEALARFHAKTKNGTVARGLRDWARYWSSTQWNPTLGAFRYRRGQNQPAWKSMTAMCLFGLAYAADLDPADASLRRRVVEARDSLNAGDTGYAKDFAMRFRSAPRALEVIRQWEVGAAVRPGNTSVERRSADDHSFVQAF